jgi:hypothetical protein
MKINVIDHNTGNDLFDYESNHVPRAGETVVQNDEIGVEAVVKDVRYIVTPSGMPYVNLLCEIM